MRPDRISQSRPTTTGPRGLVPEAYHQARCLHLKGRTEEALGILNDLFGPDGSRSIPAGDHRTSLHDAALLKAWCLVELKRHRLCKQWLETARHMDYLEADDPAAMVLELNIQLFD